jgi:hypothetical protein
MKMKWFRAYRLCSLALISAMGIVLSPHAIPEANAEYTPAHHEAASMPVTHKKGQAPGASQDTVDPPLTIRWKEARLQFGGYVKLDAMYDVDPVGNADSFATNSIPVAGDPDAELGSSTNLSARQTRLDVDFRSDTPVGLMRAYVEGDFFGSGNSFRLRHAYGEWKGLLAGQTWSTFQDISALPFTWDFRGPDAQIFTRQPQIRYTAKPSDHFEWAVAIEDPDSQIDDPSNIGGSGRSEWPDIPAHLRFTQAWGHIQLGGILRQLRFVSDGGGIDDSSFGFGLDLAGKLKIAQKNALMGHVAFGSGIGRYIKAFGGTNSDAVVTPSGEVEVLDAWAAVLGYTHHWNEQLNSTISGAFAEIDNDDSQSDDAIKAIHSFHLNLVYSPYRLLSMGPEIMYGMRENKNGADGDAVRMQFSIQYKFR